MMHSIKLFLTVIFICFCLDMLWLGFIAKNIYANAISLLMRSNNGVLTPNWPAAIVVYLVIALGIVCFVIPKAQLSLSSGLLWGGVFGLVVYGVYDFTNFSILANWPLKITLIDFIWGIVLCSITSYFGVMMQKWLIS